MKKIAKMFSFPTQLSWKCFILLPLLFCLLILLSCSDPKLENPFDPESSFNTASMQGELALTQLTDSEVKLEWQLNTTIVGSYIIKRQINSGGYEVLTTVDKDTNIFSDTGLLTANTYNYQLIGANGDVQTEPISNSISTSFAEITNFSIQQENLFSAKLTWQHNCNYEEGYIIERREISSRTLDDNHEKKLSYRRGEVPNSIRDRGASKSETKLHNDNNPSRDFVQIANLSANTAEFIDNDILPNHTYEYRIYAYTELNHSFKVVESLDNLIPAPTNLIYNQQTIMSIELNWTDNSNGEDGFKIDKKVGTNAWQIEYTTVGEDITNWTDTNAEINEDLEYRVYAYSGANQSIYINTGIIANIIPAPSNLQIIQMSWTSCELNWDFNSVGGEEGFKIERRLIGSSWSEIAQLDISTLYYEDTGLTEGETYEYQVYAYYSSYISNSASGSIELVASTVTDIDGNVYQTIQIGNQLWMAENLKVTHYRNGDAIPNVTDNSTWAGLSTGAYCVYNNTPSNADTYGNMYNWYTVDDSRGLAPDGWHVPTDEEIMVLEMHLGMSQSQANSTGYRGTNEGSKLAGNAALWINGALENDPEFGSSGFSFLPGGYRYNYDGYFGGLSSTGYLWSSTESNSNYAWYRRLYYHYTDVYRSNFGKNYGFSVRCLRD